MAGDSIPLYLSNVARVGVEPTTFRVSVERSYQLSYLATQNRSTSVMKTDLAATPTGLEPATSAVTGRRANQLRYGASDTNFKGWYFSRFQDGQVLKSCVPPTGFEPVLPP